jgi:glycosyltransferase involved in cell wall biosynthesis
MRVILVFTYGISLKNWHESGIYEREMLFYQKLEQMYDVKYTFITYGDKQDKTFLSGFSHAEVIPIYDLYKRSRFNAINLIKSFFVPLYIKKDVALNSVIKTNQLNGAWIGIILKFLLGASLIVRTGYNIHQFKVLEKKPNYIINFYKYLTKISLAQADIFICTSETDKKKISSLSKVPRSIKVVPNWVYETVENPFARRYKRKILSVGRLEAQKNYEDLIKSLKNTDIEIDIVGEGSLKDKLEIIALQYGVKVNFLGTLDFFELNNLYKDYKIFVSSSIFEGNPKVVLEALASGCIVIANNTSNIRDIVVNNNNGFTYKKNENIAELVLKIIDDEITYNEVSKNGYETIENKYLLSTIIKNEIKLYRSLIS